MTRGDDCVFCRSCQSEEKTRVIQSGVVIVFGAPTTWRRRKCQACGALYKTMEVSLPKEVKVS